MGSRRVSDEIWDKVKMCIFLTLEEDGVTSSANVEAYATQLGDDDVTQGRAHHALEHMFTNGFLDRRVCGREFIYQYTLEGALELGERYGRRV